MNPALSYFIFIRACGLAGGVETSVVKHKAEHQLNFFFLPPAHVNNLCYDGTIGSRGQLFRVYMKKSAYLKGKFEVKNIDSSFFKQC